VIVEPVLPVIAGLVAMILPILANLVALALPILAHLAPVPRRKLARPVFSSEPISGQAVAKPVTPILKRTVGGKLTDPRAPVAETGQVRRSISDAIRNARADADARNGGRKLRADAWPVADAAPAA
jgi:hypothetical protein